MKIFFVRKGVSLSERNLKHENPARLQDFSIYFKVKFSGKDKLPASIIKLLA
ncbi:hypothetical protein [Chryseobacterium sp. GP-SGM7]|uniref:hypothetical protein n=1 Tax=Chryseobacterium sp. GP-SGM7 TaxID=3411323 RepID=UPI003B934BF6